MQQEFAALRDFDPAYVSSGVKSGSTAMSAPMSGLPESGRRADIRIRVSGNMEYLR
jgi:hypothetical protein